MVSAMLSKKINPLVKMTSTWHPLNLKYVCHMFLVAYMFSYKQTISSNKSNPKDLLSNCPLAFSNGLNAFTAL
jgi:hypothetical protein